MNFFTRQSSRILYHDRRGGRIRQTSPPEPERGEIKVKRGSIAVTALPIRFPWLPIVAHIRTRRESEGG